MPPGRFDALVDDDDDEDDISDSDSSNIAEPNNINNHSDIPSYEDLSSNRSDEEMVLVAIYGDDFSKEVGTWGQQKVLVNVRPPGIDDHDRIFASLTLSTQIGKRYPYVVPKIQLLNVKGLSTADQKLLLEKLNDRATELAQSGSVMVCELVQLSEDFVLERNVDPTKSAWQQMKDREAKEEEERQQKEHERQKQMRSLISNDISHDDISGDRLSYSRSRTGGGISDIGGTTSSSNNDISAPLENAGIKSGRGNIPNELERELARQREALAAAKRQRLQSGNLFTRQASENDDVVASDDKDDDDDDGDDFDYDENESPAFLPRGASRYQTDFIELGTLGRGGGGEVVKVRNRLDRRVYAIKKILLESERGKNAKYAKVMNKKIRREVTTISRMTHRNIVRYFQAWMEGGDVESDGTALNGEQGQDNGSPDVDASIEDDTANLLKENLEEDSDNADDKISGQGFWTRAPEENDNDDDSAHSSSSWSEEEGSQSAIAAVGFSDDGLLDIGFQRPAYNDLFGKKTSPESAETDKQSNDSYHSGNGSDLDESSVKIDSSNKSLNVLYIQMEYCSTTLRKLIDEEKLIQMDHAEIWRLVRQIIEALAYIHSLGIIHRDLKPGNVFLDRAHQIQLGDFGLATKRQEKQEMKITDNEEVETIYHSIESGGGALLHQETPVSGSRTSLISNASESVTVGVGTTFYRAPEQENAGATGDSSYGVKADIFSLGIVIFEMFSSPISTYMERSETLTRLRMDHGHHDNESRFPPEFEKSAPKNAKEMICWCLQRDPAKRPSAEDLLKSDLLPRKIEVEQRYLEEALELLNNPQTEGGMTQIVDALFDRPTPDIVELTFDTDTAVKANNIDNASQSLIRAVKDVRSNSITSNSITSMSNLSLVAATSALHRSRNAMNTGRGVGGKGMMKRARMRAAGVIAMTSASSAAVEGNLDGVLGSDPRIVSSICSRLENIFKYHGAVLLKAPLLRPRHSSSEIGLFAGGPAELLNRRGLVLTLSEDLTASFARAVGRGGSAASNIKRYDIGKVYHKAIAGGHPRESLEASFDIVQDDSSVRTTHFEAEALLVVSQAMSLSLHVPLALPFGTTAPMWYLRISHTRLADAIIEICEIRTDMLKKHVLNLFSQLTAPTPSSVFQFITATRRKRSMSRDISATRESLLDSFILEAIEKYGLSKTSSERLSLFIKDCLPFPPKIGDALLKLKSTLSKLSKLENKETDVLRWYKRLEDAGRVVKHLQSLFETLKEASIVPTIDSPGTKTNGKRFSRPLFVSLDLGLRQKRRHFHGHLIFQCIAIPSDYFDQPYSDTLETNETFLSSSGPGIKIAEGGRYDDLVRKARPPGIGSTFNSYRAAPIPRCVGVRFSIGRLVELVYTESTLSGATMLESMDTGSSESIEAIRASLGHPLNFMSQPTQSIVTSVHGLDAATLPERFLVAAKLWSSGISAEYLAQSGVLASLLKQQREENQGPGTSDWGLDELCAVCAIMKIPFVVVVQPHTLREKGTVRLRITSSSTSSDSYTGNEQIVSLDNLPTTILELSSIEAADHTYESSSDQIDASNSNIGITGSHRNSARNIEPSIECIYIQNDQFFFDYERSVTKDVPNHKALLKSVRGVTQRAEGFVTAMIDPAFTDDIPVFAVADVPFWCLRDFGTTLMKKSSEECCSNACLETIDAHPNYKRAIKTMGAAIDNYMRRKGLWQSAGTILKSNRREVVLLLYSRLDDKFDLVTLEASESGRRKQNSR